VVQSACPAAPGTGQVRPEVAEVFRRYGPSYLRRVVLTSEQGRVLRSVIACRTAALGGHVDVCDHCGTSWHHYNSCRNRHCPTCQGWQAVKWTAERLERFIDTHHFHVVATVPQELRSVALANQRLVYDLLFQAVSETLLELALDRWDAIPAVTAVLHTWSRTMAYHPHVHCIVSGGGLSTDGRRWVSCRPGFLFPVKVLSALIRGKFMARFVRAYEKGTLRFVGTSAHLADPEEFAALRRRLYDAAWVVHAKPPFGDFHGLVRYLSRYTHRVAISSSRLLSISDDAIAFKTRGDGICRLHPDEFVRRFLLHVLPRGFRKIRHYGLLAPSNIATRLPVAQRLARSSRTQRATPPPTSPTTTTVPIPTAGDLCPACSRGHLIRWSIFSSRSPPVPP